MCLVVAVDTKQWNIDSLFKTNSNEYFSLDFVLCLYIL